MCILFYIREISYKSLFIRLLPVISNTRHPSLEQLQSNFPANIYEMIMRGKNRQELPGVRNYPVCLYLTYLTASDRYGNVSIWAKILKLDEKSKTNIRTYQIN